MSKPAASAPHAETTDLRAGTIQGFPFQVVRWVLYGLLRLVFGMRVEGAGNVPAKGGVLLVSNHLCNADPVFVSVGCPRPAHFMAKKELFEIPVFRHVMRWFGEFPVDRGAADRGAIRRALATLDQGIALGMFPEGTRSTSGALKQALPGAGLIALRGKAPIVPVAVIGTEKLPLLGSKALGASWRGFRGARIVFGEPFTIPETIDGKRTTSDQATDLMMRQIAALLPERYRGVYAEAVA
ncbi:MAG: lysophospholipid acyltransferase family protein [Thermomicrobiales bacterium]